MQDTAEPQAPRSALAQGLKALGHLTSRLKVQRVRCMKKRAPESPKASDVTIKISLMGRHQLVGTAGAQTGIVTD